MSDLNLGEKVVATGTYSFAGTECDVRIVFSPVRYGTGDYEDPPEIANDTNAHTYYVQYGSVTEPGRFNAGGGSYDSLSEALSATEAAPEIGHTIRWHGPAD